MSGYFDWAATTPPDVSILRDAFDISLTHFANPSSVHALGMSAREILNTSRFRCAQALSVPSDSLYFTSGGTESNHIPLLSLLQRPYASTIVVSAIEHPAISAQVDMMKTCGWNVVRVYPNSDGIITASAVIEKLTDDTAMLCVMAVNNETGAIQPIADIAAALDVACKGKKRPKFHVDAVQAAGKIGLAHFLCDGVDTCAFSAHKICGPRGVGLLYMKKKQESFVRGGLQESGVRSGTENLSGVYALSHCLEKYCNSDFLNAAQDAAEKRMAHLISFLHSLKRCTIIPSSRTENDVRFSPWIVQVAFDGIPGEVLVRALSSKGLYISTGSACASRKQSRPILETMHIDKTTASYAVRFSQGYETCDCDIEQLCSALSELCSLL